MDSQDVIDRAYVILRDRGITRGAYARNEDGMAVPVAEPQARTFCSVGALSRAAYELGLYEHNAYADACDRIQTLVAVQTDVGLDAVQITTWNDTLASDEQILALFKKAASPTLNQIPLEVAA
jgi:hypothetical protein